MVCRRPSTLWPAISTRLGDNRRTLFQHRCTTEMYEPVRATAQWETKHVREKLLKLSEYNYAFWVRLPHTNITHSRLTAHTLALLPFDGAMHNSIVICCVQNGRDLKLIVTSASNKRVEKANGSHNFRDYKLARSLFVSFMSTFCCSFFAALLPNFEIRFGIIFFSYIFRRSLCVVHSLYVAYRGSGLPHRVCPYAIASLKTTN